MEKVFWKIFENLNVHNLKTVAANDSILRLRVITSNMLTRANLVQRL